MTSVMPRTRLEQLRMERWMSRAQLAAATEVSKGTIRRLEEREGGAQIGTLRKLAEFFDVPGSELLGDAIHTPLSQEAA